MDNWSRLEHIFHEAMEKPNARRGAYLLDVCESPEELEKALEFVKASEAVDDFMSTSIGLPLFSPSLAPSDKLGNWRIDKVIGSGGMGEVYLVRRETDDYKHIAALKLARTKDEKYLARFEQERRILAKLEHANIGRLIDGGVSDNELPFFVMEYVDGQTITEHAQSRKLDRKARLKLFNQLCRAVSHAHARLVLHRDIKPANVLVSAEGEVKLIDFGVSDSLDKKLMFEAAPTTKAYAAPEQLSGQQITTATDIFSLGGLLHELLTDKRLKAESDIAASLPEDLRHIIMKSRQKNPADRYDSVDALLTDIGRFANSEPVEARAGGWSYRVSKFLSRYKMVLAISTLLVMSLVAGIGGTLSMLERAQVSEKMSQAETVRANKELEIANWHRQQSRVDMKMSETYAEGLRYAFGQNKTDELSELLIEYHTNTIEKFEDSDPEHAAYTSFAIGEHFIRRNDYRNGRLILEPWVMEEYGPSKQLLALGQAMLAHAYKEMNETENAAKLFSKSASFYIGTPGEYSMDHAAPATLAGILSSDKAVENDAAEIIEYMLKTAESSFVDVFFLSRRAALELKRNNFDKSYEALQKSIEIVDSGRVGNFRSEDKLRIKLAFLEIFHKKNFLEARQQIKLIQQFSESDNVTGFTSGQAYLYKSVMAWAEGDYETAAIDITEAIRLIKRYNSDTQNSALLSLHSGVLNADLQNYELANRELENLLNQSGESYSIKSKILDLYIVARRNGLNAAQSKYSKNPFVDKQVLETPEYRFYLDVLIEDGLRI